MHAILGDLGHINFQITESYKMICLGGSGTFQFIYYYIYIFFFFPWSTFEENSLGRYGQ
jgi:hypothetical protein